MKIYEIKEDCCEELIEMAKKIAKYAAKVEEALESSQINHRIRKEWDDDDEDYDRKYKGTKYSRF